MPSTLDRSGRISTQYIIAALVIIKAKTFTMTITPDSLIKKLEVATKDPRTYVNKGDKIQVFLYGTLIAEIPLGSGQITSTTSTTYR